MMFAEPDPMIDQELINRPPLRRLFSVWKYRALFQERQTVAFDSSP